mmetsp:Transcript_31094/g.87587  ORF Transcript_31094/g.87587 Transcript_31094/m.87587 type:complete len:217 (+) Transcript_31094:1071-1721(+)
MLLYQRATRPSPKGITPKTRSVNSGILENRPEHPGVLGSAVSSHLAAKQAVRSTSSVSFSSLRPSIPDMDLEFLTSLWLATPHIGLVLLPLLSVSPALCSSPQSWPPSPRSSPPRGWISENAGSRQGGAALVFSLLPALPTDIFFSFVTVLVGDTRRDLSGCSRDGAAGRPPGLWTPMSGVYFVRPFVSNSWSVWRASSMLMSRLWMVPVFISAPV